MFDELFEKGGLSLDRLRTLCEVAEKGSIGEATKGDSNRQTLFSRQIGELEKFFSVELLNRETRPHRLSLAGEELSGIAKAYFTSLKDFRAKCNDEQMALTIGAGESNIQWLLMPRLDVWTRALPEAAISLKNLRTMQVVEELLNGDIDLGLIRESGIPESLESAGGFEYGYNLFVPKRMRKKFGERVCITEVAELPLAVISGTGEFKTQIEDLAEESQVKLNVRLECSSYPQVATAIMSGSYCGLLPYFATELLSDKFVNAHSVDGSEDFKRKIVFAWNPKKKEVRPVLAKAVDFIRGQKKG